MTVLWDEDGASDPGYSYCVALDLADGSVQYVMNRGRTVRLRHDDAVRQAAEFSRHIASAQRDGDPLAIGATTRRFASYRQLLSLDGDGAEVIACVGARVVRYSALVAPAYDAQGAFYAPLCALRDSETELEVGFGTRLVLITNPLRTNEFLANWRRAGIELTRAWHLHIIDSDAAFDSFMRRATADGLGAVVDPTLDATGVLVRGALVDDLRSVVPR